ncbi:MAG: serine/threonine protein kinase [Deltaproteobacteria bacterium]|nr:serine/threonine protein kinase [Deltaproteobacteria bacterium]
MPESGTNNIGAADLDPGIIVGGNFRIERLLGSGGLGALYRAHDGQADEPVALRILPENLSDQQAVAALQAALETFAPIEHKNLVGLRGMGHHANLTFLVQEYVDGQPLGRLLEKKRRAGKTFSMKGAFNVVAHVSNGLTALHSVGVHGALNPNNILVTKSGRIKVADGGLAVALGALPEGTLSVAGTGDAYLAPEMHNQPPVVDPRTDVYALGLVASALLTGQAPGENQKPPSALRPELPKQIDQVIGMATAMAIPDRYMTPMDFKEALLDVIQQAARSSKGALRALSGPQRAVSGSQQAAASSQPSGQAAPDVELDISVEAPTAVPQQRQDQASMTSGDFDLASLVEETAGEDEERYLLQIGKLDYGPFTLREVKVQIRLGKATGKDIVVDTLTGDRKKVKDHPVLGAYFKGVKRHKELTRRAQTQASTQQAEKRKRHVFIGISLGVVVTVVAVFAAIMLYKGVKRSHKGPTRRSDKELTYEATWDDQSSGKKGSRRHHHGHRRGGSWAGGKWNNSQTLDLGSEGGASQTLSRHQIYSVMSRYNSRIGKCLLKYGLGKVTIHLQIAGSGRLTAARTSVSGPAASCIRSAVRSAKFPSFNGTRTTGSYTLKVQ